MDASATLKAVQALIEAGNDYEAHQQILARSRRLRRNVDASLSVLVSGADLLFSHGKTNSAVDIVLELISVLEKSQIGPDDERRLIVTRLIRKVPFDEPLPSREKLVKRVNDWSLALSGYPAGHPELHDTIGSLYADAGDAYKAESHLVLGSEASLARLAQLEFDWYREDDRNSAGIYAGRAVLPFVLLGNLCAAQTVLGLFVDLVTGTSCQADVGTDSKSVSAEQVELPAAGKTAAPALFADIPLLNFISLLVPTVASRDQAAFSKLRAHYRPEVTADPAASKWNDILDNIAEGYFGIRPPVVGNPLFDMMGSFFGGGGFGGGNPPAGPRAIGGQMQSDGLD